MTTPAATAPREPTPTASPVDRQADLPLLKAYLALHPETRCPACRYSIGAIDRDVCPECGHALQLEFASARARGTPFWAFCYAMLAGAASFSLITPLSNLLWHLVQGYTPTHVPLRKAVLEFWPLLAGLVVLLPATVLLYRWQRRFEALKAVVRWPLGLGLALVPHLLIMYYIVWVYTA